jgi:hypothetical protein
MGRGLINSLSSTREAGLPIDDTHFNVTYSICPRWQSQLALGGPIDKWTHRPRHWSLRHVGVPTVGLWGQLARNFQHSGCNLIIINKYSGIVPSVATLWASQVYGRGFLKIFSEISKRPMEQRTIHDKSKDCLKSHWLGIKIKIWTLNLP